MKHDFSICLSVFLTLSSVASAQTLEVSAGRGFVDDTEQNANAVILTPGLKRSKDLPTLALINARKKLVAKKHVPTTKVRELADLGDGFAAYRFAQLLEEKGNPALNADVAHYYGIAAATGRGGAIKGMIRALEGLDPSSTSEGRIRELKKIFVAYLDSGNSYAVEAAVNFHLSEKPFGKLTDQIDQTLQDEPGVGTSKLSLQLASVILQNEDSSRAELFQAKEYLEAASASASLSVSLIAQNLLPLAISKLSEQTEATSTPDAKESQS